MQAESIAILKRLSDVRRSIRWRLGLHGACVILAGGCVSLLTVIALDWLLELPPLLRVFGAVMFVAGFGLAALYWFVRPLQAPLTLQQVAGKLEQHFGDLDDRLTSTVSFLTQSNPASPALMRRVIANTDQIISALPLERVLTHRPLVRQLCVLIAAVAAISIISYTQYQWLRIGLRRYVTPFEAVEWPHAVGIDPVTADLKVPMGESATVYMRVVRGADPQLRGVVHLVDDSGERRTLTMNRDSSSEYSCTIDGVSGDMTYWFEAGDDSTRKSPGHIRVVHRPEVLDAYARIHPPVYARQAEVAEYDLDAGAAKAVIGSTGEVLIRTSRAVGTSDDGSPLALLEPEAAVGATQAVPLTFVDGDSDLLHASFVVDRDVRFRVHLLDRDGFSNRGSRTYAITTRPDLPPRLDVEAPARLTEATPTGGVPIRCTIEDDFGLQSVALAGRVVDSEQTIDVPLSPDADVSVTASGVTARVDTVWPMASLGIEPPATLLVRFEAVDNRSSEAGAGQVTQSGELRIHVIDQAAYERRVREEFVQLEQRLRRTSQAQASILEASVALAEDVAQHRSTLGERIDELTDLAGDQGRTIGQARDLAGQFRRLRRELALNRLQDGAVSALADELDRSLTALTDGAMAESARRLQRSAESREAQAAGEHLDAAIESERAALRTMRDLLERLDHWGDFESLLAKTREILDRQQKLRGKTAGLERKTVGRQMDELSREAQTEVRELARGQRQLTDDMNRLLQRLRDASTIEGDDAGSAAAMRDALRAAAGSELADRMSRASEAIEQNRLSGAGMEQRNAERGLMQMLSGLEQREIRRLAELAKELERAEQAVAELLEQQKGLLDSTREAVVVDAAVEVQEGLSADQAQVRRNARALGRDLTDSAETADAGDLVSQSARSMRRAVVYLAGAQAADAVDPQVVAVERLTRASEILQERARQSAHSAAQKMMAAIRSELVDIRSKQADILDETNGVFDSIRDSGRLDRAGVRAALKLGTRQEEVATSSIKVLERVEKSLVYALVMRRVVDDMNASRQTLGERRVDQALVGLQQRIVRRLDELITALKEAAKLPPVDEFVESSGGAGGQSAGKGDPPPIPRPAELLMLKSMQASVLEATIALDESGGASTESRLKAAESLGQRQAELRELTQWMMESAAGGS